MKTAIKITVLMLSLIIVAGSAFACNNSKENAEYKYGDYYEGINTEKEIGYLANNGTTEYTVMIPAEATETEKQAANELVDFTRMSTGVKLSIVTDSNYSDSVSYISIGRTDLLEKAAFGTDYNTLNGDGFVIKTVGKNVIIDAGTDRGFLYGTYEIIEKVLGVRFLTEEETYIPNATKVMFNEMDITSVPAFKMRVYLNSPTFLMNTDMEYIAHTRTMYDWLDIPENYGGSAHVSRRGNNTHNARFYVPAEKYGTRDFYSGEFLTEEEGYEPHPELWWIKPGSTAPMYEPGGEGSGITLNWLNGITEDGKLDESMEISTAKVVIEEMKKDALANPDAEFFVIDQEDIGVIMDADDPTVKKYTPAGVLVRFCNVVATELQKWADEELDGRKINLVTFAYQQTQSAPVVDDGKGGYVPIDETVVPVENLYIRLAYTSAMYYPYDDERQPDEVKYTIVKWASICKHFWFWGYDAVYTDYISYSPTLGQAYGTVQLMRELGVQYMLMQSTQNSPNDWQANIKSYVWSKLMWNPDREVSALVNEFLEGYYGIVAPYVREMMNLFDAHFANYMVKEEPDIWFWAYGTIGNEDTLTPRLLDKAVEIMEKAEKVIEEDQTLSEGMKEKLSERIARVKLTPKWMQLFYFSTLYPLEDSRAKLDLAQKVLSLSVYGDIKMLNEGTGLAGYLALNYGI